MENIKAQYPNELYRGLSTSSDIIDGMVTSGAFQFEDYEPAKRNDDGFCELSINWNDDDGSLVNLQNKKKLRKGTIVQQFSEGYCILDRETVDDALSAYIINGTFNYERDPIQQNEEKGEEENLYHGNLLLAENTPNRLKKMIQDTLATIAGRAFEWS